MRSKFGTGENRHAQGLGQASRYEADYIADIREDAERNGQFVASVFGHPELSLRSRDPEHDLCHAIVSAGLPDGAIQFFRNGTPSMRFRSVHRTAGYRIELGESYPYRRVKRRSGENIEISRCGVRQDGVLATGGSPDAKTTTTPVCEDTATASSDIVVSLRAIASVK